MGFYMENGVAYGAGITPITIEGTLVANATSIAFTNDAILEGERYNIYAWDKPTVKPTNMVVSGHTLTLTYPAQSTDTRIKVVINENVNTLMFDDTNKADKSDLTSIFATGSTNTTGSAISAGTYFYLNGLLVRAKADIATNATFTLNTNYEVVTVGALNELRAIYSTSEVFTGGYWTNGKPIYRKVYINVPIISGTHRADIPISFVDTLISVDGLWLNTTTNANYSIVQPHSDPRYAIWWNIPIRNGVRTISCYISDTYDASEYIVDFLIIEYTKS